MFGPTHDVKGLEILKRPPKAEDLPDAWQRVTSRTQLLTLLRDALRRGHLHIVEDMLAGWQRFLETRPLDARTTRVLLGCARAIAGRGGTEDLTAAAADVLGPSMDWAEPFARGWVADVLQFLADDGSASNRWQRGRVVTGKSSTLALLVRLGDPTRPRGVVATLLVEAIAGGSGSVYSDPRAHAFLRPDVEFTRSVEAAVALTRTLGLWPGDPVDIRWSLTREDGTDVVDVAGPSAGLAFGLCAAQVLARLHRPAKRPLAAHTRDLIELDLRGVAASAVLEQDGRVSPVGHGIEKVVSAAKDARFPKSHTVIVAAGQSLDLGAYMTWTAGSSTWRDSAGNFVVEHAASFDEAVSKVRAQRWRHGDDELPARPVASSSTARPAAAMVVVVAGVAMLSANTFLPRQSGLDARAAAVRTTAFPDAAVSAAAHASGPSLGGLQIPTENRFRRGLVTARGKLAPGWIAVESDTETPAADGRERAEGAPTQAAELRVQPPPDRVPPSGTNQPVPFARTPLAERLTALQIRRDVIALGLDNLRRRQEAAGFTLRSDMASAEQVMTRGLAAAAIEIGRPTVDPEAMLRSLNDADGAINTLEEFLGMRRARTP